MSKDVRGSLMWGGGIMVLALMATFALQQGWIDDETATRIVITVTGLSIVWYGNRIPKTVVPIAWYGRAARVAGWSMVLSGLVYAGLFAFAPIPVAVIGGCSAVVLGIAVTVYHCFSLRAKAKASA